MNAKNSLWLLVTALIVTLSGCGEPTPEQARKKLEDKKIPVDAQSLMAKTKQESSEDTARLLVIAGADPNARQDNGMTALMSAVFNGQHEAAQALIERGADVNATAKGFTALHMAVERNDLDMARLLLSKGANPNLRPDGGASALNRAEALGNSQMLELLKKGAK